MLTLIDGNGNLITMCSHLQVGLANSLNGHNSHVQRAFHEISDGEDVGDFTE